MRRGSGPTPVVSRAFRRNESSADSAEINDSFGDSARRWRIVRRFVPTETGVGVTPRAQDRDGFPVRFDEGSSMRSFRPHPRLMQRRHALVDRYHDLVRDASTIHGEQQQLAQQMSKLRHELTTLHSRSLADRARPRVQELAPAPGGRTAADSGFVARRDPGARRPAPLRRARRAPPCGSSTDPHRDPSDPAPERLPHRRAPCRQATRRRTRLRAPVRSGATDQPRRVHRRRALARMPPSRPRRAGPAGGVIRAWRRCRP